MKYKAFASKHLLSGNTTPNGKQLQSVNIVSMVLDGGLSARYYLHSNLIASIDDDILILDWCGYYTPTTTHHLNHVLNAVSYRGRRLGYSNDKKQGITSRGYIKIENGWVINKVRYQDGSIIDASGDI